MVDRIVSVFSGDSSLLGEERETVLASRVAPGIADIQTDAWRLTGQPVDPSNFTALRIEVVNSGGDFQHDLRMPVGEFIDIPHADQGDTLGATNSTLKTLNGMDIRIGRTAGNRVLVQAPGAGYANTLTNFRMSCVGIYYYKGELERYLGGVQYPTKIRRWLFGWASSSNAVAPSRASIRIDGSQNVTSVYESGDTIDWLPVHLVVSAGSNQRWACPVDVFWSHETQTWDFEIGLVYSFSTASVYDGGFAQNQFGPWSVLESDDWEDVWIRVRDPQGSWIVSQIREASPVSRPVNWRPGTIFEQTFYTSEVYKIASFNIDWTDRQFFEFYMRQYPDSGAMTDATLEREQSCIVSADRVRTVESGDHDTFQRYSNWFHFGLREMTWGQGPVDETTNAYQDLAIFRVNLLASPVDDGAGLKRSNRYTVRRWNSAKQWVLGCRWF